MKTIFGKKRKGHPVIFVPANMFVNEKDYKKLAKKTDCLVVRVRPGMANDIRYQYD